MRFALIWLVYQLASLRCVVGLHAWYSALPYRQCQRCGRRQVYAGNYGGSGWQDE